MTTTTTPAAGVDPPGARTVLALNSGSSSLKFGLYRVDAAGTEPLLGHHFEHLHGTAQAGAVAEVARHIAAAGFGTPAWVGHRIVHGGPALQRHTPIDAAVLAQLEQGVAFAPLHTPAALAVVRAAQRQYPAARHVACLDTAFHAGLPAVARVLPIARSLLGDGIRRYGFHGLSCESIVRQLGPALPERLVIAHLGHGASVTAVLRGGSVDTSMGLTPTGGLPMGTRSGDLDPGLLVHLMREQRLDADGLEDLVNHRSGLLGVSGVDSDLRVLRARAGTNPDAALALALFDHALAKQVAGMAMVLGGLDGVVLTGGIGENDVAVREELVRRLAWIGGVEVRVLPSQEDVQIARHTRDCAEALERGPG